MQSVSQSLFSTLALNELSQDREFIYATRLYSSRIVKNITPVIEEHELVVDTVLASLDPSLETIKEKYHCY